VGVSTQKKKGRGDYLGPGQRGGVPAGNHPIIAAAFCPEFWRKYLEIPGVPGRKGVLKNGE